MPTAMGYRDWPRGSKTSLHRRHPQTVSVSGSRNAAPTHVEAGNDEQSSRDTDRTRKLSPITRTHAEASAMPESLASSRSSRCYPSDAPKLHVETCGASLDARRNRRRVVAANTEDETENASTLPMTASKTFPRAGPHLRTRRNTPSVPRSAEGTLWRWVVATSTEWCFARPNLASSKV